MKTKKEIFILDEDLLCLKWLWRWKLLTTRALAVGVYKSKKLEMTYRRLLKLEKAKYIQPYWSRDGKRCLWMLNDKGYQLLNQNFPNQFRAGYKTENPNHDYWVSAIHLANTIQKLLIDEYAEELALGFKDGESYIAKINDLRKLCDVA